MIKLLLALSFTLIDLGLGEYKADATSCSELFADGVASSYSGFVTLDGKSKVPVGPDGYPTGDFGVGIIPGNYTLGAGRWTVYLGGQATISPLDATFFGLDGSIGQATYDPATNTTTCPVDVGPSGKISLAFTATRRNPGDSAPTGLSRVQVMRPIAPGATTSHSPTEQFSRGSLAFRRPFRVDRTLDLNGANNDTGAGPLAWTDRKSPADPVRLGAWDEIPWEDQIALANATGHDLWLNVPDRASDDYLAQLVRLLLYGSDAAGKPYAAPTASPVHPPLVKRCYLETSNETWNPAFSQFHRIWAACYAANQDFPTYRAAQHKRLAAACGSALGSKLLPVLLVQNNDVAGLKTSLDWLASNTAAPLSQTVYGAGSDWYRTLDSTGAKLTANPSPAAMAALLKSDPRYAGIKSVAYEGGLTDLQPPLSRDPAILPLARQAIEDAATVLDVACLYCGPCYTSWGIATSPYDVASPRYQAALAVADPVTIDSLLSLAQTAHAQADISTAAVTQAQAAVAAAQATLAAAQGKAQADADAATAADRAVGAALRVIGGPVIQTTPNGSNLLTPTDAGYQVAPVVPSSTPIPTPKAA